MKRRGTNAALNLVQRRFAVTAHRFTKPRLMILNRLVSARKFMTARELHELLRQDKERIGLATVYRTLETLRGLDLVSTKTQANSETGYLFCAGGHHHHAVCTSCGKVDEVPCRALPRYERMLAQGLRFRLTGHQVEFFGTCARCS